LASLEAKLNTLITFDNLSDANCFLNKIDPFAKIVVFMTFLVCMVSLNKYNLIKTIVLTSFVIALINTSPLKFFTAIKFSLVLSPIIFFFVIFNPIFDTNKTLFLGYKINAGYISAATTLLKFFNTTTISLLIVSSTGFFELANALSKLKVPRFITLQLVIMYRFIFLFISDVINTVESIKSKSPINQSIRWIDLKGIFATFFVRGIYRSEDVYTSMLSRGFEPGKINQEKSFKPRDLLFLIISLCYIILIRIM